MLAFEAWRLTRPPFSLQGGSQRAMAVFGGAEALNDSWGLNAAMFGSTDEQDQESNMSM